MTQDLGSYEIREYWKILKFDWRHHSSAQYPFYKLNFGYCDSVISSKYFTKILISIVFY